MDNKKKLAHEVILDDFEELLFKTQLGSEVTIAKLESLAHVLTSMRMSDEHNKVVIARLGSIQDKMNQDSGESGVIEHAIALLK